jgi:hypothetical protein
LGARSSISPLAVLGWGGLAGFFSSPARIALAAALLIMVGASVFAGGNLSPGEREDRSNRWVLAALSLIGIVGAFLDRIEFWTLDGDAVRWLGVVLFAIGGALRLWPVYVLGTLRFDSALPSSCLPRPTSHCDGCTSGAGGMPRGSPPPESSRRALLSFSWTNMVRIRYGAEGRQPRRCQPLAGELGKHSALGPRTAAAVAARQGSEST